MKHPIKILTIEDDPNIVELIKLYCEKMGFLVLQHMTVKKD